MTAILFLFRMDGKEKGREAERERKYTNMTNCLKAKLPLEAFVLVF